MQRPHLVDLALAGALCLLGVGQVLADDGRPHVMVAVAAMTLPVAVRRSHPLASVTAAWLALFLTDGLGDDVTSQGYASIAALWITVYSVARHGRPPQPVAGLVWALGCVWGSVLATTGFEPASLLLTGIVTVAPWGAGNLLRSESLRRAEAEEQSAVVTDRAVTEERARIAREVHDVLGHTLGLMVLHLGAAEAALPRAPDIAQAAVRTARRAGKEALAEVRYLIGLDPSDGATPPVPGIADVRDLVERLRGAGADIRLDGPPEGSWSTAVDLAGYRIAQESLTNAIRHGRGPIQLSLTCTGDELQIRAENAARDGSVSRPGAGLVGMRERARSCGGEVHFGREGSRFIVAASLPGESS
jgi:signal transduction histidine kinase